MIRSHKLALTALSAVAVASVGFIAGATLIAASIGSPAAAGGKGGPCGVGTGQCRVTQTDAFGFWFTGDPSTGDQVNINATRSTFMMRPRGGPATITLPETVVNISTFSPATNTSAGECFVIPDSQFVVASDLQVATLKATLTADELCPGFMTPQLGASQAAPSGGGGGAPGGGFSCR